MHFYRDRADTLCCPIVRGITKSKQIGLISAEFYAVSSVVQSWAEQRQLPKILGFFLNIFTRTKILK